MLFLTSPYVDVLCCFAPLRPVEVVELLYLVYMSHFSLVYQAKTGEQTHTHTHKSFHSSVKMKGFSPSTRLCTVAVMPQTKVRACLSAEC